MKYFSSFLYKTEQFIVHNTSVHFLFSPSSLFLHPFPLFYFLPLWSLFFSFHLLSLLYFCDHWSLPIDLFYIYRILLNAQSKQKQKTIKLFKFKEKEEWIPFLSTLILTSFFSSPTWYESTSLSLSLFLSRFFLLSCKSICFILFYWYSCVMDTQMSITSTHSTCIYIHPSIHPSISCRHIHVTLYHALISLRHLVLFWHGVSFPVPLSNPTTRPPLLLLLFHSFLLLHCRRPLWSSTSKKCTSHESP